MPDVSNIRERPPQLSVAALLEAEGLPASDLTESRLEHFFFIGSDAAPSALVGLEIYGEFALLRSLVVTTVARTQGLGSALVLHAEEYAAAHQVRSIYLLTTTAELTSILEAIGASIARKRRSRSNRRASSLLSAPRAPPS